MRIEPWMPARNTENQVTDSLNIRLCQTLVIYQIFILYFDVKNKASHTGGKTIQESSLSQIADILIVV